MLAGVVEEVANERRHRPAFDDEGAHGVLGHRVLRQRLDQGSFLEVAGGEERRELQTYVSMVESGRLEIRRGPIWTFDQLRVERQAMDENRANGKMVVVVR